MIFFPFRLPDEARQTSSHRSARRRPLSHNTRQFHNNPPSYQTDDTAVLLCLPFRTAIRLPEHRVQRRSLSNSDGPSHIERLRCRRPGRAYTTQSLWLHSCPNRPCRFHKTVPLRTGRARFPVLPQAGTTTTPFLLSGDCPHLLFRRNAPSHIEPARNSVRLLSDILLWPSGDCARRPHTHIAGPFYTERAHIRYRPLSDNTPAFSLLYRVLPDKRPPYTERARIRYQRLSDTRPYSAFLLCPRFPSLSRFRSISPGRKIQPLSRNTRPPCSDRHSARLSNTRRV